jgi:hypothetical protein
MCVSNFPVIRRLHHWKLNRTEIHMKRMTLLTTLALVFSLFTVTAAIAGSGPGTGQAEQAGDTLMAQRRTNGGECQAADDCQTGEQSMAQVRERVMNKILAMLGAESAEAEAQYRHFLDNMLQKVLRLRLRVLFV